MKALVTGGAGFVGSNLVGRLLADGHDVTVLDNLCTGRRANLTTFESNAHFAFVEHDVIEAFPKHLGAIERIYHLACPASPPHYQRDPIFTTKTAFLGTLNALELCASLGARILIASTSEVYGDPEVHPQTEDYRGSVNPIGPRACYDEGKRAAESLTADFERARNTDVRIARIFNTYGPNMDPEDGRVVSNFLVQALRGAPLTLYGDGAQSRSFCYVDDLVAGLIGLMETATNPGPVNLGNPNEFTVRELATEVANALGVQVKLDMQPLPVDDPRRRQPDIGRARALFGFEPKTPLAEGLRRTAMYFQALEHARTHGKPTA